MHAAMKKFARLKWPLGLTAIGIGLITWALISLSRVFTEPGISLLVPGETTFTISKPGNYTLWSETSATFDGQWKTFSTGLPSGATIKIINKADGAIVPLQSRWPVARDRETSGVIRVAIGKVRFDRSGLFQISAEGLREERALRLDEFDFKKLISIGIVLLAGPPVVVAGLAWGLFILVSSPKIPPGETPQEPPPLPVA
jgi:hypothetical protein